MSNTSKQDFLPMGPSSNMVIELIESKDPNDPCVRILINDNLVGVNQCNNQCEGLEKSCKMSEFIANL